MFSLLFGFAFGFLVGFLLMAYSLIEKLKTHDCTYDGTVKWIARKKDWKKNKGTRIIFPSRVHDYDLRGDIEFSELDKDLLNNIPKLYKIKKLS